MKWLKEVRFFRVSTCSIFSELSLVSIMTGSKNYHFVGDVILYKNISHMFACEYDCHFSVNCKFCTSNGT